MAVPDPAAAEALPEVKLTRSRTLRVAYAAVGLVFLGVGVAGLIVPGFPGTVNLLIALWLFSMSSERMHRWMLTNRWFGQSLRDYKAGLGMPRRVKITVAGIIVVAVGSSVVFVIDSAWLRIGFVLLGAVGVWFVLTRPTREIELAKRAAGTAGV